MPFSCPLVRLPTLRLIPLQCASVAHQGSLDHAPGQHFENGHRQRCIGKSCLLENAMVELIPHKKPAVSIAQQNIPLGYRHPDSVATVHQQLCKASCSVPGLTIFFALTVLSPYHFFRDNLAHILRMIYAHGIAREVHPSESHIRQTWPLRNLTHVYQQRLTAEEGLGGPVRLLLWNTGIEDRTILGYLTAVTSLPIWTGPVTRTCVHFERLVLGTPPRPPKSNTGHLLREPLMRGLGIKHCRQPRGESTHTQGGAQQPRITLLLREKASHRTYTVGRLVLNPLEVESALSRVGRVRVVSFENYTIAQQLQVMLETDVLVGVHGAGLSNAMFLDRCGIVVELFPLGAPPAGPYLDFHVSERRSNAASTPPTMNEMLTYGLPSPACRLDILCTPQTPYVSYKDTFCNISAEATCDPKVTEKDKWASRRPLLVDTKVLLDRMSGSLEKWRSCYHGAPHSASRSAHGSASPSAPRAWPWASYASSRFHAALATSTGRLHQGLRGILPPRSETVPKR